MKTPAFWQSKNFLSNLLLPLSAIYGLLVVIKQCFSQPQSVGVPIICVGNLTAGGAGKTPVALALGALLKQKNMRAFFLSKGYGGNLRGPLLVDPAKHLAQEVGDEPLLLAKILPTIVAKNRRAGAKFAVAQGAQLIVMDDGFQNRSLVKTLSLLVVDGQIGFGNARLIPAGPLREPLQAGFARAQAIVVINPGRTLPLPAELPVLAAKTHAVGGEALKGKKVLAFCGLAYPQKFFEMLKSCGAELVETVAFADHHLYTPTDIATLERKTQTAGAQLITTAKDAVRLPKDMRVAVVEMALDFDTLAQLETLIGKWT